MSSKLEKQMADAVSRRRPPEANQADVASTIIGRMVQEGAAPAMLQLTQLVASPYQRRGRIDDAYVENLVESIREEGLFDPILVRPLPPEPVPAGCYTVTPPLPRYEIVAGHHRVAAFGILGRVEIPGFVRHMTNAEAARALTSENTTRKDLTDWELYKHMVMLRKEGAVPNNTQMARVLNVNRTVVQLLDGFAALPQSAHDLLDDHPGLIGYHLAHKLKSYCPQHETLVFDALCLLARGKLTQAGVPAWVDEKANPRAKKYRKDFALAGGVRVVVTEDGARVTGNLDYERLQRLVEEHLPELLKADS
jgi:ParB family chromosome partitioning protein